MWAQRSPLVLVVLLLTAAYVAGQTTVVPGEEPLLGGPQDAPRLPPPKAAAALPAAAAAAAAAGGPAGVRAPDARTTLPEPADAELAPSQPPGPKKGPKAEAAPSAATAAEAKPAGGKPAGAKPADAKPAGLTPPRAPVVPDAVAEPAPGDLEAPTGLPGAATTSTVPSKGGPSATKPSATAPGAQSKPGSGVKPGLGSSGDAAAAETAPGLTPDPDATAAAPDQGARAPGQPSEGSAGNVPGMGPTKVTGPTGAAAPPAAAAAPVAAPKPQQSVGTIVGAVIGAVAGLALLVGLGVLICCHQRKRSRQEPYPAQSNGSGLYGKLVGVGNQTPLGPIYSKDRPDPPQAQPAGQGGYNASQVYANGRGPATGGQAQPYQQYQQQQPQPQQQQQQVPWVGSNTAFQPVATGMPAGGGAAAGASSGSSPAAAAGYGVAAAAGAAGVAVAAGAAGAAAKSKHAAAGGVAGAAGEPRSKQSRSAAAAAAAASAGARCNPTPGVSRLGSKVAMDVGYTGDELQSGLSDLKYKITNRLLPAVDCSPTMADPVALWLDAGVSAMEDVRSHNGGGDYTASDTFVIDWRTHKLWDWLNHRFWRHIPTDKRVLTAQVPSTISQADFARHMLDQIKKNPNFEPYVTAVDAAVTSLIKAAVEAAVDSGMLEAGAAASSQAAAEAYYQPVLWQVCSAALKLHLQVQGTADTAVIFVPGAVDSPKLEVPPGGLVCKKRRGGSVPCCLCERPGVFSSATAGGVEVWVPAEAATVAPMSDTGKPLF